jgi:hypothetical protein
MSRKFSVALAIRAWWELLRYDCVAATGGFRHIHHDIARLRTASGQAPADVNRVCEAVVWATCFYWKPVQCLQRSVAAVRLLRHYGVEARLVIGYRSMPFFSHAWVEVNGAVVNDSRSYRRLLHVIETV